MSSNTQNMIPVVEDLLPPLHNSKLLTLLYRLAEWHALAKLRMHTEITLQYLEKTTTTIGKELRSFRDTICAAYTCKELPREISRRARRQRKKKGHSKQATQPIIMDLPPGSEMSQDAVPPPIPDILPKTKFFNLCTYKLHALGDYAQTIRLFGTTDSYSTQIVSQFTSNVE